MAQAALNTQQMQQFNSMLQSIPEVKEILNTFKQMFAQFGYGGVHEVSDNTKTSIGDVALQESQKNATQIREEAMKKQSIANLPPRPQAT